MTTFSRLVKIFKPVQHRYAGHPFRLFTATLKAALLLHVFWQYGYTIEPTRGASMLPTLEVIGDHVLISKAYRRGRGVKVGDVVTFDSVKETNVRVIKRVLGMPGDYVLRNSPGLSSGMIQVPEGHCWVVGDNLPYSSDSRHFGPVPLGLIQGKILAKVFPWSERKWIEDGLQLA